MPVTWSYWKTSHLAEGILPSSATNPDFYCLLANQAIASRIRSASGDASPGTGRGNWPTGARRARFCGRGDGCILPQEPEVSGVFLKSGNAP